jgi:hypothetical protein
MLDSLLASYSSAEPRPGMDTRIRATLDARARQRRRGWILLLAGSVAVVLAAVVITSARTAKQGVPVNAGVQRPLPEVGSGTSNKSVAALRTTNAQFARPRREKPFKSDTNRAILQMASLSYGDFPADALPPEPEKPAATRTQYPEPAIA